MSRLNDLVRKDLETLGSSTFNWPQVATAVARAEAQMADDQPSEAKAAPKKASQAAAVDTKGDKT